MSRNVSLFFSCLNKWMQDELQVVLGVGVGQKRSLKIYVYFFFFIFRNFVVFSTVSAFLHFWNSRNIITLLFVVVVVVVETMIRIQKLG